MTTPENQVAPVEQKQNDKEYNFRQLEQKLQQERNARLDAERRAEEAVKQSQARNVAIDEDEDDSEPYVDHKRLNKKLNSFEKNMDQKIEQRAEAIARTMVDREKKDSWLKQNNDFYDVLQNCADKFAQHDPDLAESILQMPDTFERQKLVYKNIKALGLHKPPAPQQSIQDKVDANRRSPYYQPSGIGTAPYNTSGDFSETGQKAAYQKMKDLQKKLRM